MPLFAQDGRRQVDPDEAYKNNCMRCHTSTQQYSPRKTKTIVMHMRVRANLTQEEAQAILEYLTDDAPDPRKKVAKESDVKVRSNGQ
jgi:mono/diheme cytochrome c family protein